MAITGLEFLVVVGIFLADQVVTLLLILVVRT